MNNKNLAAVVLILSANTLAYGAAAEKAAHAESAPAATPITATTVKADATVSAKAPSSAETRASASWQTVFSEPGRRVEIDNASITKLPDGKVQAYGRIMFDKPLPDAISGGSYRILEALNIYDCEKRTFATQRRIYRKDEKSLVRDEPGPGKSELPVRSGSLDEKILRAACRPGGADNKASFAATVNKARSAADDALPEPRKELLRTSLANDAKTGPAASPTASSGITRATKKAMASNPAAANPSPVERYENVQWAYAGHGGPENWSKLSPDNKLCASGSRQSPIDIRDGIQVDLEPIKFGYRPSYFRIIDNGYTIQTAVSDNRISLLGKDYDLVQFHFHRPSEERINGRSFDMAIHFVHKSHDGQIAILAVLVERGNEHPVVQTLWNYLPLERHLDVYPPGVAIDLAQLLPEKRGYATYMGSLASPPCTEGVQWLVMQQPIQMSAEQIGIFARLYPGNARPIQAQNGRLIKESR